jgi:PilZ domain
MATPAIVQPHSEKRRLAYRQKLRNLAYIRLDSANDGVLRDISESGIAVQVLSKLRPDQRVHVRLDLANPRLRLEAEVRVVWTDSQGQAGLEFLDPTSRSRRLLKEWLFTQILADAHRTLGDETDQLLFSTTARPAIRLQQDPYSAGVHRADPQRVRLFWFHVSALKFSRFVDATALLCSVLLFSLLALVLTDLFPSWLFTVAFVVGVAAVFATLYWLVFAVWFGVTPGERLVELASTEASRKAGGPKPARPRFR